MLNDCRFDDVRQELREELYEQHTVDEKFCESWPRRWYDTCTIYSSEPRTRTTNSLRRGTQFGVPLREELVTVCVGCVAMRSDEVVRAIWRLKFWNVFQGVTTCLDEIVKCVSWTVRNLYVTDGTTWLAQTICITLPSWQTSCHENGTTWHAILWGIAGTKFVAVRGLLQTALSGVHFLVSRSVVNLASWAATLFQSSESSVKSRPVSSGLCRRLCFTCISVDGNASARHVCIRLYARTWTFW